MVEVKWTLAALEDLNDIGDYIAKDSVRYAEITVDELFNATSVLRSYPYSGRIVPEFEDDFIREIIKGNYRIVYKVISETRVDVVAIANCARLLHNVSAFSI